MQLVHDQVPTRPAPAVSAAPDAPGWVAAAVHDAGARFVPVGPQTQGLLWFGPLGASGLGEVLSAAPHIRWVQLPSAGVDAYLRAGLVDDRITWTSAKGAFAEPVAEHALALTLAALRRLPERARARSWGAEAGLSLYDADVLLVGAGGIARALLELLAPFRTRTVVVRRRADPVAGADRVVTTEHLTEELGQADVVVLAAALTDRTRALLGAPELAAMKPGATLVNIARGALVDTDALVELLSTGHLGAAALDVTDPEPLPAGHPLWDLPNALITPHTADTPEMVDPLLRERVTANLRAFVTGEPLSGVVDVRAGY
ncbi:phosphoglycerate dehydrogenase-like enzyme [Isoptericola sp. CG 20/1183]|uniref:Phosphoglycerate dehydrogenase-like enzyme n=1 Tax=Isoptericola halotolerans TaxID=300560 RepID=A0ABX5EC45_9MICO|nr:MULTISPECIES: NAD(P)-dependent oxidoreductase [Isoptericola]PRZ02669.1 phosphoglycerate dehydrogenase-like enzyme [Isoptericola sp. CG 20/1183]PRZ03021.1 phosphoglycerate dehydrogenase-like enzyme [Isoptericola halotolerans]